MKQVVYIKSGNEKDVNDSALLLIAGTRYCSFGVLNLQTKEFTEFGYYYSGKPDYKTFFAEHETFKRGYGKVALAFDTDETVFIPLDHYHQEDSFLHLQAIYGLSINSKIISEEITERRLHNIYRMPDGLMASVSEKYPVGGSRHVYSLLMKNEQAGNADLMMLDFRPDDFSVIIFKQNQLILAQTFYYSVPEDVLYHLLKCCQQFNLSQQEVKLSLSGLIEKDSALYRELYKYFIHLDFDGLYAQVKLADELKVYPEHYYSTISKLAACVL